MIVQIGDTFVTDKKGRLRVPGKWGYCRIVEQTSALLTVKWPWYWRLLNNLRDRWRRR